VSELETNTGSQEFSDADDIVQPTTPGVTREGLPRSYRMRADAHYVEQLSAPPASAPIRMIPTRDIETVDTVPASEIEALVRSIRAYGVLHPLLVRSEKGRYRIIAGRRRFQASQLAGLHAVPCFVHHLDGKDAESLAQADNLRHAPSRTEREDRASGQAANVLRHLSKHLNVIRSTQSLLAGDAGTMEHRVALDLVQAHALRATWLISATELVASVPRSRPKRQRPLGRILDDAVEAFGPESRVAGVSVKVRVDDRAYPAQLDGDVCGIGITGALLAMVALEDAGAQASITVNASQSSEREVVVTIAGASQIEASVAERFFDSSWTERPGEWPALMGALSARVAAERSGGSAAFSVDAERGAAIRLVFRSSGTQALG